MFTISYIISQIINENKNGKESRNITKRDRCSQRKEQ